MKLIANLQPIDQKAIREAGIPAAQLMEAAGTQVAQAVKNHCRPHQRGVILCGPGNNGGDGFVCARKLYEAGYQAVTVIFTGERYRAEALANLEKLMLSLPLPLINAREQTELARQYIQGADFVVDALFGSGLTRPITGVEAQLIAALNQTRFSPPRTASSPAAASLGSPWVLAVDLPSGIEGATGQICGCAVQADATITLAAAKPGLYLQPGKGDAGAVTLADIGIPSRLIEEEESSYRLITPAEAKGWLPLRLPDSHKYHYGHVLVIAGSEAMPGAAVLCSEAAMSAGVGLVTLAAPATVFAQLPLMPEIMRLPLPDATHLSSASVQALTNAMAEKKFSAVLLGPGLGRAPETQQAILTLLEQFKSLQRPVIVDADGLHAISEHPLALHGHFILTPHVGEAARLLGTDSASVSANLLASAAQLRHQTGAQIVLKSATTVIAGRADASFEAADEASSSETIPPCVSMAISETASQDLIWISPTGNPGMATAGSGDVLSGIIAAQAAQRQAAPKPAEPAGVTHTPFAWQAAPLGVYLHGVAGDMAADRLTPYAMRASSITQHLPQAFQQVLAP